LLVLETGNIFLQEPWLDCEDLSKLGHQQSLAEPKNHFDQRILFVSPLGLLESSRF